MKIPKISTSVAMALSALALFVSLWLVWYNNFYYVLNGWRIILSIVLRLT